MCVPAKMHDAELDSLLHDKLRKGDVNIHPANVMVALLLTAF